MIDHKDKILFKMEKSGLHTLESFVNFKNRDEHNKYRKALTFLSDEGLIIDLKNGRYRLTNIGYEIIEQGGWTKYLEDKKNKADKLELKESIDLELAEKTLKEFPKIKNRANIGLLIAGFLALLQLVKWIIELSSK